MRWQRRLKSYFSEDQALFFENPDEARFTFFREHLSPDDELACHPQPKHLRRVERSPLMSAQRFGDKRAHWDAKVCWGRPIFVKGIISQCVEKPIDARCAYD
jgi:hypothetical protein